MGSGEERSKSALSPNLEEKVKTHVEDEVSREEFKSEQRQSCNRGAPGDL
jgi:hypothetical protein